MRSLHKKVAISNGFETIDVTLDLEDGKYAAVISLNGVLCHLEAMDVDRFVSSYMVDDDPDYSPKLDKQGHAFLLVPFCS